MNFISRRAFAFLLSASAAAFAIVCSTGCHEFSAPARASGKDLNVDSILLDSGYSAFVELGDQQGWVKISLEKHDFYDGKVTVYYSPTRDFSSGQLPELTFVNQINPCIIKMERFDLIMILDAGSRTASYLEFLSGKDAMIRRVERTTAK